MKKTLVIGINGFTGIHLWHYLKKLDKGDVVGTFHKPLNEWQRKVLRGCTLTSCDINSFARMKKVLREVNPQNIYFLPAVVTVGASFDRALSIYETNILGMAKFFEALIALEIRPKILVVGSAEAYGKLEREALPIAENHPLKPVNPYGVSKMVQEALVEHYQNSHRLFIHRTRTFHFTGPMQPNSFVVSDFASQIAKIEMGKMRPVIYVGNLKAKRDFSDIRDVVRSYYFIMEKAKAPEVFNVCSGRSVSIDEILKKLIAKSNKKISIELDPKKLRKLDVPDFRGDNQAIKKKTGWTAEVPFDQMLTDVLDWHREALRK